MAGKRMVTKAQALEHYANFLKQAQQQPEFHRCLHCDHIGEAEVTLESDLVDSMNDRPPTRQATEVKRCEACGFDDLTEAFFCTTCNIRPATIDGTDDCAICYAAHEAEQDAIVARIKELKQEITS